ncbi:MAG: hypothetical protein IIX47_00765 [Spirochaetaceae bacterium]|nr:hypothetical protein [Spirochaetaceae bacterium]MBQ1983458.1 hypothetical protein [Spirochaetaceae bacterium]
MSATLKQLSELKQICTEQKKKAQNIQTEIGFSLLSQSDSSVLVDDLNRYNASLEKSKENDLLAQKTKEKSLEIENIQEKISLVKKDVEDLQTKQNLACLDLGQVLYSNYREAYADFFKPFYDEISELDKRLESLESQSEVLKSQIETQGFFGKLVNQVKLTSSTTSVNSAKKKKEGVFQKAGSAVVSSGKIDFIRSQENIEYSILSVIENIERIKNDLAQVLEEQHNLNEKEKSLKDEFAKMAEGLNLKSKLSHIEKANFDQQQERTKIAFKVGEEFSKKYISETGEKFSEFDSMQVSYPALVDLSEAFNAINKAEIQLEIYQTESDIESCVARISNMQQTIIANENKIENLKSNNIQLAEKITSEGEVKDSLLRKKSELEQKL